MKVGLKLFIYIVLVVVAAICSIFLFKNHPEVQLAFFIPGVFLLLYAKIRDELFIPANVRARMSKGK